MDRRALRELVRKAAVARFDVYELTTEVEVGILGGEPVIDIKRHRDSILAAVESLKNNPPADDVELSLPDPDPVSTILDEYSFGQIPSDFAEIGWQDEVISQLQQALTGVVATTKNGSVAYDPDEDDR